MAYKVAKIAWLASILLFIPIFLRFISAYRTTGFMTNNTLAYVWALFGLLYMVALVLSFSLHILFNLRLSSGMKVYWWILIWVALLFSVVNVIFLSYYWLIYVWREPDSSSDLQASPS